jgi:signal transduction histidine kinase
VHLGYSGLPLAAPQGAQAGPPAGARHCSGLVRTRSGLFATQNMTTQSRRSTGGWLRRLTGATLRVPQATATVYALMILAYSTSAFLPMPAVDRELLFTVVSGGLGLLVLAALRRQHLAVRELSNREEQLATQSALLQSTLENMGEGLSVFDRNGQLIAWNAQFSKWLGTPLDLTTVSLRDIMLLQARRGDFGPLADPEQEADERVATFYREVPALIERTTRSGLVLQIRRRAMPDGAVVSLYSDITERKAAESKMEHARVEAELASRAKSDFLANMSHELRTPLNAIIGFSEAISSELLGPVIDKRQLEYIKDIHSSGLLLLSIINDVLDMSKIEAGKLELARESIGVRTLIRESLRMVAERARSRNLRLESTFPSEEITLFADERAIKQIMLNLLSNAVKFSHEGGRIDVRAELDPAGALIIEVADRGIGMSTQEIERALQPFGQAKSATTRTHGGTGLGLPIAKGLAEAHAGQLEVVSRPGQGTVVRVVLPQAQSAEHDAAASQPERRAIA